MNMGSRLPKADGEDVQWGLLGFSPKTMNMGSRLPKADSDDVGNKPIEHRMFNIQPNTN